jgi:hypothetical protein
MGIRFVVYMAALDGADEVGYQFLVPGDAPTMSGAWFVGNMLDGPEDGLYLWEPIPGLDPSLTEGVARQWAKFTALIREAAKPLN